MRGDDSLLLIIAQHQVTNKNAGHFQNVRRLLSNDYFLAVAAIAVAALSL